MLTRAGGGMSVRFQASVLLFAMQFFAASLQAGVLCDAACTLTIDFPGGGRIEAAEAVTVTFGTGGLVDTAGSVTAYLAGETLTLNAGERLEFSAGGSFDIGSAGNVEFSDLAISTDGGVTIAAVGGAEVIRIEAGDRLAFLGGGTVTLRTRALSDGTLELLDGGVLNILAPGGATGPAAGNLTIANGTLSLNGTSVDLSTGTPGTLVIAGTNTLQGGTLVLDPQALNAVIDDPSSFDPVTFDPVLAIAPDDTGSVTLLSAEGDGASAVSPAWLLLLIAACTGRSVGRRDGSQR